MAEMLLEYRKSVFARGNARQFQCEHLGRQRRRGHQSKITSSGLSASQLHQSLAHSLILARGPTVVAPYGLFGAEERFDGFHDRLILMKPAVVLYFFAVCLHGTYVNDCDSALAVEIAAKP